MSRSVLVLCILAVVSCQAFKYDRLTPANAALLLVDHQTGLANGVQDQSMPEFMTSVLALAEIGKIFNLPTIVGSSVDSGPNGPLFPEILQLYANSTIIHRPGEINAWDNPDFVQAVSSTGRRKLIIAGISTDVCATFVALSALSAGYEPYFVIDSSGTWNKLSQELSIARLTQAGVIPMTWFAVGSELQSDWRRNTGQDFAALLARHLPFYKNLIVSHLAVQQPSTQQ